MPAFGIQGRVDISEAVIGELAPEVAGTLAREFGAVLLEPTPQQAELARRRINALVQALASASWSATGAGGRSRAAAGCSIRETCSG